MSLTSFHNKQYSVAGIISLEKNVKRNWLMRAWLVYYEKDVLFAWDIFVESTIPHCSSEKLFFFNAFWKLGLFFDFLRELKKSSKIRNKKLNRNGNKWNYFLIFDIISLALIASLWEKKYYRKTTAGIHRSLIPAYRKNQKAKIVPNFSQVETHFCPKMQSSKFSYRLQWKLS